jgi:hypothetical protein
MPIDVGFEHDRFSERCDPVLHHPAPVAIHDADRPTAAVILARRHQILPIFDKEIGSGLERVVVYAMNVASEQLLYRGPRAWFDGPGHRKAGRAVIDP